MSRDVTRETARRLQERYALSERATMSELIYVCHEEGIRLFFWETQVRPGYCRITNYGPQINLRSDVPASVLAHELFHALKADQTAFSVIYTYPDHPETDEERAAHRFAELLCGEGSLLA